MQWWQSGRNLGCEEKYLVLNLHFNIYFEN